VTGSDRPQPSIRCLSSPPWDVIRSKTGNTPDINLKLWGMKLQFWFWVSGRRRYEMRDAKCESRDAKTTWDLQDILPPTTLRSVLTWYLSDCQHSTPMLGVCHFCNSGFNLKHAACAAWLLSSLTCILNSIGPARAYIEFGPEPAVSPSVATDASGRLRSRQRGIPCDPSGLTV
jgi:hypothetical protein